MPAFRQLFSRIAPHIFGTTEPQNSYAVSRAVGGRGTITKTVVTTVVLMPRAGDLDGMDIYLVDMAGSSSKSTRSLVEKIKPMDGDSTE